MDKIILAHGEGGRLTRELIEERFVRSFDRKLIDTLSDSAVVDFPAGGRLAFTTDAYIVSPYFFKGGDIGSLSISGTVNDLAMSGARPLAIVAAFILEEGFPLEELDRINGSASRTARRAGVKLVGGDTKVLPRGKGDSIFIVTSGVGVVEKGREVGDHSVRVGDRIVVSGTIAEHGAAIAAHRHGLKGKSLGSDCAPVNGLVDSLFGSGIRPRSLHDPTRGGVATLLNDVARRRKVSIVIEEEHLPVRKEVAAVCDILGLDPLYLASEGRFVGFFGREDAEKAISVLKRHTLGRTAAIIGEVRKAKNDLSPVVMRTRFGSMRPLDELSGLQLPRIC